MNRIFDAKAWIAIGLTAGSSLLGVGVMWGVLNGKVAAETEHNANQDRILDRATESVQSQHTDIALIQADMKSVKDDMGDLRGDVKSMKENQVRQELILQTILLEVKKDNQGG